MRVNIYLDDIRDPRQSYDYTKNPIYNNLDWKVVRNYDEFVSAVVAIQLNGDSLGTVSFDHDLCVEHMEIPFEIWDSYTADQLGLEMTGLDCAKFLTEHLETHDLPYPGLVCHSQNPVGKKNIEAFLMNWMDHREGLDAE